MAQSVEIATFHQGVQQSSSILSERRESRAGWAAAGVAAAATAGGMVGFAVLTWVTGFALHTPSFGMAWVTITGLVSGHAFYRARERTRRYHIGVRMDADAFSGVEMDLVHRNARGGYNLALAPGMSGHLLEGTTQRPIEALTESRQIRELPMARGTIARIEQGLTTFVVRCEPVPSGR